MAAPRAAFAASVLRATPRLARLSPPRSTGFAASQLWHYCAPAVYAPRTMARPYSVKQPGGDWPSLDFSRINQQIKINRELAKTGNKQLGNGEQEIIFVGMLNQATAISSVLFPILES